MSGEPRPIPPALTKLLSAWEHGAKLGYGGVERQTHCGGALLFVNRAEAVALENPNMPGHVRWKLNPSEHLPDDGQRHSWRVACGGDVMVLKSGVTAGLCSRCEGSERAMRTKARERKESANLAAKREAPRTRRGSFDR